MKLNKLFFLTLIAFSQFPKDAWGNQSSIFNFSSKKVYYSLTDPSQTGKIPPFKSTKIFYQGDKTTLNIYTSINRTEKTCLLEITDKLDAFVTDKNRDIKCSRRAERLPKEF